MTKVRPGNCSRRWCAAPMPETPAPTMRTSTWPASWISVWAGAVVDAVVMSGPPERGRCFSVILEFPRGPWPDPLLTGGQDAVGVKGVLQGAVQAEHGV